MAPNWYIVSGLISFHPWQENRERGATFLLSHSLSSLQGLSEGITQTTKRGSGREKRFVWNFPVDATFKSTNPHGCKQGLKDKQTLHSLPVGIELSSK